VNLLSDPSFQPGLVISRDDEHYDGMDISSSGLGFDLELDDDDPLDAEGFPHALAISLSPTEIQMLDSFRLHQNHHTDQNQKGKKKITAYSLVPDIDSFLSSTSTSITKGGMNDDVLRNEVIANLIGAEEWLHVDERYNDDVWGYLRPAVEAAAAEIKEQKEENPARGDERDGPAVKRLKMILRHMARL